MIGNDLTKIKSKKFICFIVIIIFVLFLGFKFINRTSTNKNLSETVVFNDDGTVTLPLNAVSYGVTNPETNAVINWGEVIIPIDEKINVIYKVEQNMPKTKEYMLIVLINNKQHEYILDNKKYSSYPFSLDMKGKISFNIEIETNKDEDKEILFVLFPQPNYNNSVINSVDDLFAISNIGSALTNRYLLYKGVPDKPLTAYSEESKKIDLKVKMHGLYLCRDTDELKILATVDSGEKVLLTMSNDREYEISFALSSFLDWEQNAFPDGEMIKYFKIPPKTTKVYEMTMPIVDKNTPFQVFAVPNPFSSKEDEAVKEQGLSLFTSIRTIIVPIK